MSEYDNYSEAKLVKAIGNTQNQLKGTGDTLFKRLLHEIKLCQLELELKIRELQGVQLELKEARLHYADLYDFAPVAYFTFDSKGYVLDLNRASASLLCEDMDALRGAAFVKFIARHERSVFKDYLRACFSGHSQHEAEFELWLADGRSIKIQSARVGTLELKGVGRACRMAFIDVTEHRLAELKVRLASSMLENTHEGMMLTDAQHRIVAVNPAFLQATGYDSEEIIGYTPAMLKSGLHDGDFDRMMMQSFKEKDAWQGVIRNRRKNGEIYQERLNIKVIRKSDGEVDCYLGVFSDMPDQKEWTQKNQTFNYYDPLTGLANRTLLYDRLQHSLLQSRRADALMAVLLLKLGRQREINAAYGDRAGDHVLKQAAQRLVGYVRESDTLSRLEHDEFVAILRNIESAAAVAGIADRMMKALSKPFLIDDLELHMRPSIGISIFPWDGNEASELLKNADTALNLAKSKGRNNYQYYAW